MSGDMFDRQGKPITLEEFAKLLETGGFEYKRVAYSEIGDFSVSTVWLGIDHNWGTSGPPIIFETMVFVGGTAHAPELYEYTRRYETEEQAIKGHAETMTLVKTAIELASGVLARDGLEESVHDS